MYVLNFEGFEMKAYKESQIRDWLDENQVDAAFKWGDLRQTGQTLSLCERWLISKADGRALKDVDWISNYVWQGDTLVSLTYFD